MVVVAGIGGPGGWFHGVFGGLVGAGAVLAGWLCGRYVVSFVVVCD